MNPRLALILIIIVPIIFMINFIIVRKAYPLFNLAQENLENVNTKTQENLENIRVVKAFNRSDFEKGKFDEAINELRDNTMKANKLTAINTPLLMIVINFTIVGILYFGGVDVITGYFTIAEILAFITYLGYINGALRQLTSVINMFPRAESSSRRVLELLEAQEELVNHKAVTDVTLKGKIDFKNVSFSYDDHTEILHNISFNVNPGERLGIIGTTGSGKTTLVNLISRFYDPTTGDIYIDDLPIQEYDLHVLRSQISTVMQKALLFAGTVGDNIAFAKLGANEEEILEAATSAQAIEFITNYDDKFNAILGERGVNLSGGQKQRLSMARSLITKPKILIFDDSTSAVDMATESKILKAIDKDIKDTTVVIIAQRIRSIMNANKILVLENGKVSGFGTHEELLKTNTLYKEINDTQLGGDSDE